MKTVYQTDDDGWLAGLSTAFESPLEPGVFHLPSGCTETAPPDALPGQTPRLVAGEWVLQVRPAVSTPSPVELLASFLAANPDVAALINGAQPTNV